MNVRSVARAESDRLLSPLGIAIGEWSELKDKESSAHCEQFKPPVQTLELYEFALALMDWVGFGDWVLLQFDNSTMFQQDELAVICALGFDDLLSIEAESRTLVVDGVDGDLATAKAKVVLMIVFSIAFEWNMYLTSSISVRGQRIALLDGVAFFFGEASRLNELLSLVERFRD